MSQFFDVLNAINGVMLGVPTLLFLLAVGVLFTFWSGFCQYRSVTHGVALIRGKVPGINNEGPGAISHFQAMTAALSATVGLGNIGGVAIAVSLGGPGAVFWLWVVGFVGMALKTTEVTLSMLYRNIDDPDDPHGGTMWVAKKGLGELFGSRKLGGFIGGLFAVSLIAFGITGGNMFQAWNVANLTQSYFGVDTWISGVIMAVIVGAVVLGGIKRIGTIAGYLVPFMCGAYVLGGIYVIIVNAGQLPGIVRLIFTSAFAPAEASGAFTGAAVGTGFIYGMRRALFSSESGLGSAPIAHSAVKTPEPVTEGVVAGLEPLIDTLVVCTLTAFVILSSGVWNRGPVATWDSAPPMLQTQPHEWQPGEFSLPARKSGVFTPGEQIFAVIEVDGARQRQYGNIALSDSGFTIDWRPVSTVSTPVLAEAGVFSDYPAATLTAKAYDTAFDGLGRWMVTLTVWMFAISTLITYGYYGEQGMVYLLGPRSEIPFRVLWCVLIAVTCLGFIRTDAEIDALSTVALGFMLAVNLPTMLLLAPKVMGAYRDYFRRKKLGQLGRH